MELPTRNSKGLENPTNYVYYCSLMFVRDEMFVQSRSLETHTHTIHIDDIHINLNIDSVRCRSGVEKQNELTHVNSWNRSSHIWNKWESLNTHTALQLQWTSILKQTWKSYSKMFSKAERLQPSVIQNWKFIQPKLFTPSAAHATQNAVPNSDEGTAPHSVAGRLKWCA